METNELNAKEKRNYFNEISQFIFDRLRNGEELVVSLNAEDSLFVRFNDAKVRQITEVDQASISLLFHENERTVRYTIPFTWNGVKDKDTISLTLENIRREAGSLPIDPYQVKIENHGESEDYHFGKIPSKDILIENLLGPASELDFTGILTSGSTIRANQNSKGQNHWFYSESFFVDYSLFSKEQKAVKGQYAGTEWESEKFNKELSRTQNLLSMMDKPTIEVPRGKHKTYFAPGAVSEILDMLSWGGISYQAVQKGMSPFVKIQKGEVKLSPLFSISENFELGLSPQFNSLGEMAPTKLELVEKGELKNLMTSSRSAIEYNVTGNGADGSEGLRSPIISEGNLKEEEILKELGTGLYISNLHYLNWSDRQNGRITGMTRYACFWVEDGEIKAPIKDLRFDESLYHFWGDRLESVTEFSEINPRIGTYGSRSVGGSSVPGMMVNDFTYTL